MRVKPSDILDVVPFKLPEGELAQFVRVIYTPHPVILDGQVKAESQAGSSLACMVREIVPAEDQDAQDLVISVGGVVVAKEHWPRVKPAANQLVEIRRTAQAPLFAAIFNQIGVWLVTAVGATGLPALLIKGFVSLAGGLLVNKLLAPKKKAQNRISSLDRGQLYGINGSQNQARPYEMVGITFGRVRVALDYLSLPYSTIRGQGDQYLHALYTPGIRAGYYSDLRIGSTPITSYNDVSIEQDGWAALASSPLTIWTDVDTIAGGQLITTATVTTPIIRSMSPGSRYIGVDLEGQVSAVNGDGSLASNQWVIFEIVYREVGTFNWLQFIDASNNAGLEPPINAPSWPLAWTLRWQSLKPLRWAIYKQVDPSKTYEVRVAKATIDLSTTNQTNNLSLTQFKCFQGAQASPGPLSRLAVTIRSSGQLNGTIDQLSAVIHEELKPDPIAIGNMPASYTSNCAAALLKWYRGYFDGAGRLVAGYGLPDEDIDLDSIVAFRGHCVSRGLSFNMHYKSLISCDDVAEDICRAGMAVPDRSTGKYGVSFLSDAQPIESMINMATIEVGSFSVDYYTGETADELVVTYADYNAGGIAQPKSLRVQNPTSSIVNSTASLQLDGVDEEAQAAMLGRIFVAQNIYQRKSINFNIGAEHLVFRRNSVISLSHDLAQWGYSGRLKALADNAGVITLTLDEEVPSLLPSGASPALRVIGLRLLGETDTRIFQVAPFSGPARSITLVGAWPVGVPLPGSVPDEPVHECIWIYDFKVTPGLKARVVSIEPFDGVEKARISVVPEPSEMWDYINGGSYTPPANNSLLDRRLPTASRLRVSEELKRQGGSFYTLLNVGFDIDVNFSYAEVWGNTVGNPLKKLGETRALDFDWQGTIDDVWYVEVRPFDGLGRQGNKASTTYALLGLRAPPSDVANLALTFTVNGIQSSWSRPPDIDYSLTHLKLGSDWASALDIVGPANTSMKEDVTNYLHGWLPVGVFSVVAKHVDSSGNESALAASASITVAPPSFVVLERIQVNANTASVRWADSKTSQPILRYAYRLGTPLQTYAQAAPWGSAGADSRSDVITSNSAGSYLLWFTAVDVAGNESTPTSVPVDFAFPTDFFLNQSFEASFNGTGSNVTINDARVYMLWQSGLMIDHYSRFGWANASAKTSAGKLKFFEPGALTSSYSEEFDMLAVAPTVTIKLAYQVEWLSGSGTITSDIAYKELAGDAWTTVSDVTQIIVSAARYIKITLRATGAGQDDLLRLASMFVECGLQRIYESFSLTLNAADVGGTPYECRAGFTNIQSATANPLGIGNAITRAPVPVIDDSGIIKRVLWLGYDQAGNRVSGLITGQIAGV